MAKKSTKPSKYSKPPAVPAAPPPKPDTSGYEARLRAIESEKSGLEATVRANDEKIERLKNAYSELETLFYDVDVLFRKVPENYNLIDYWSGTKYTAYDSNMRSEFYTAYSNYDTKIYEYLDDIDTKKKALESENKGLEKQIKSLSNEWNSVSDTIRILLS